jgi:hypothetical protein
MGWKRTRVKGAVDFSECPFPPGKCKCGKCIKCGFHKHMSVHGPLYGEPPGSKPWGHTYVRYEYYQVKHPAPQG